MANNNFSISRRNLLLAGITMATTVACGKKSLTELASVAAPTNPMPERVLGKTGLSVPVLGLGGAGQTPLSHLGKAAESYALIEAAINLGIRYFDTAASYGSSEEYLGQALQPYRQQVIIASKTAKLDRDSAWRELEQSLKRLKTDYLDIWQLHHISFTEELEQIFSNNGAAKAIEEAKEQKIIRFSGITGHHEPDVIAEALKLYPFDMTLISLNAADSHHPRPFAPIVLPVAQQENVGVVTMKIPAYGKLLQKGVLTGMEQAMGYVLSLSGVHSCIIAAENVTQLESNVRVAQQFQPLTQKQLAEIEKLTAQTWQETTFFRRWT
jgi:aryl-alcohol dehydrogenase-like predicted oxidoreductase